MRVLVGVPDEQSHDVEVLRKGEVVDELTVIWRTPDSSESIDIQELRAMVLSSALTVQQQNQSDDAVKAIAGIFAGMRDLSERICKKITEFFVRIDDEDWEVGDLERMLKHDHYRGALLNSLVAVANGEGDVKNVETPGGSGQ